MLSWVRNDWFHPDNTRSGRFPSDDYDEKAWWDQVGDHDVQAGQQKGLEAGQRSPLSWLHDQPEDGPKVLQSDGSGAGPRLPKFLLPPTAPAGTSFIRHLKSRVCQLKKDDYVRRPMCGRPITQAYGPPGAHEVRCRCV